MFKITLPADRAEVDMAAVARAFGISVRDLNDAIQLGAISRWFEVNDGDQDNKPHHIFVSTSLGLRVDVDDRGAVDRVSKLQEIDIVSAAQPSENRGASDGQDLRQNGSGAESPENREHARRARLDALLDDALEASFPASDPIAISFARPVAAGQLALHVGGA